MTVTVVLSSDGGKMSLFQDLKLKRRKVDSRCSSDGKKRLKNEFSINLQKDGKSFKGVNGIKFIT